MQDKLTENSTQTKSSLHQDASPKKSSAGRFIVLLLIVAAGIGGYYFWNSTQKPATAAAAQGGGPGGGGGQGGGGGRRGGGGGGAVPVVAAAAVRQDLPVYMDGLGSVTAFNTVTVKSRVSGELVEVDFKEGQDVNKGDLIAVIDPRPYQVALAQAQANLTRDQAQQADAKLNADRYAQLVKEGIIPQQQSDTQAATANQLSGTVAADQAAIDNAKLNLVYTRIIAPISGRVGLRLVDQGNIVQPSDPAGLLVITQVQPISVIFTLPEDALQQVVAGMHKGSMQVKAMTRDNGTEIATGNLLTIDNEIDQTTGTFKSKAVFENKERSLWPNQFVNARLLLDTKKGAITIPSAALQNGSQGTFVYAVKSDNTVEVRPVKVGITEGVTASIDSGLSQGDEVVTDGQDRLQAGSSVVARVDGAPIPDGPVQGRRGGKGGNGQQGQAGQGGDQSAGQGNGNGFQGKRNGGQGGGGFQGNGGQGGNKKGGFGGNGGQGFKKRNGGNGGQAPGQ